MFIKLDDTIINVKNIVRLYKSIYTKNTIRYPALYIYSTKNNNAFIIIRETDKEIDLIYKEILATCDSQSLQFLDFADSLINTRYIRTIESVTTYKNSIIRLTCDAYCLYEEFTTKETANSRLDEIEKVLLK